MKRHKRTSSVTFINSIVLILSHFWKVFIWKITTYQSINIFYSVGLSYKSRCRKMKVFSLDAAAKLRLFEQAKNEGLKV
jgi:glutamyl-tRNA reductase